MPCNGSDPTCEACGRSVISRFGDLPPAFCEACDHEFELCLRAGKVTGWLGQPLRLVEVA